MSTVTSEKHSLLHPSTNPYEDFDDPFFPIPDAPTELPTCIPPAHRNRTLVLCFDGTGDEFDEDNSNIVQFFAMLKKNDSEKQMVYYQAGIGTYIPPSLATPLATSITKSVDQAVAWNLPGHVMGGYKFLMQNYRDGDRICIFGFSRGAYTARGLAGMIHKVGLLPACNSEQIPFAYRMYKRMDDIGWEQSVAFKRAFSIDVEIEFVGVWDTVNSVGIIPRRLPYTTNNSIVRTFRHALALDERRAKFRVNHWNRPKHRTAKDYTYQYGEDGKLPGTGMPQAPKTKPKRPEWNKKLRAMEAKYAVDKDNRTDSREVWFAGCHCDVGGGSVENHTRNSLARIPLRWMIRECFRCDTGIMFITETFSYVGLDPAMLYPRVKSRPDRLSGEGSKIQRISEESSREASIVAPFENEEEEELRDALSPVYDQLSLGWGWWLLELLPLTQRCPTSDTTWEEARMVNLGQGRTIPRQTVGKTQVHRSVQIRMEAEYEDGNKYIPKASFSLAKDMGRLEWVE